jgi:hypothetical protein
MDVPDGNGQEDYNELTFGRACENQPLYRPVAQYEPLSIYSVICRLHVDILLGNQPISVKTI